MNTSRATGIGGTLRSLRRAFNFFRRHTEWRDVARAEQRRRATFRRVRVALLPLLSSAKAPVRKAAVSADYRNGTAGMLRPLLPFLYYCA